MSDLGLEELSTLSGWILAYRNAGMQEPKSERKKHVKKLDEMAEIRRSGIVSSVEDNKKDRLSLQMLALGLAEDLHLDSSNKRYTSEQRAGQIKGVPGWTEEKMLEDRLIRVRDRLNYAPTEAPFASVENSLGAKYHFLLWANLLTRLELVDVPKETMNALSKR